MTSRRAPARSSDPIGRVSASRVAAVAAVRPIARLNARAWGVALGVLAGLALLAATWILVVLGGPVVGPRLGLLAVYLPGYAVTWWGGLVGFCYAFAIGYAGGWLVSAVYNRQLPAGR